MGKLKCFWAKIERFSFKISCRKKFQFSNQWLETNDFLLPSKANENLMENYPATGIWCYSSISSNISAPDREHVSAPDKELDHSWKRWSNTTTVQAPGNTLSFLHSPETHPLLHPLWIQLTPSYEIGSTPWAGAKWRTATSSASSPYLLIVFRVLYIPDRLQKPILELPI